MTAIRKHPMTRVWALAALGLLVATLVVALVLVGLGSATLIPSPAPTPCPDAIACHALKRMSTPVAQP